VRAGYILLYIAIDVYNLAAMNLILRPEIMPIYIALYLSYTIFIPYAFVDTTRLSVSVVGGGLVVVDLLCRPILFISIECVSF